MTTQAASITDTTMLIGLKISSWTASKKDLDATHEVATNHLADHNMGSYNKKLLTKGALDGVKKVERELKAEWNKLTLPWEDTGFRLASNEAYFKFAQIYREAQIQHSVEVNKFIAAYPALKLEAKTKLGSLYKDEEYPEVQDLREKFELEMPLRKTPETSDLRNRLIGDDRAKNEAALKKATEEAVKDIYCRFQKQLVHITEKLKTYKTKDADSKKSKTFHDSLITNMTDLIDLLPILNVTQDAELDNLARTIKESVCKFDAETLREDENARSEVIEQTDAILSAMGNFLA